MITINTQEKTAAVWGGTVRGGRTFFVEVDSDQGNYNPSETFALLLRSAPRPAAARLKWMGPKEVNEIPRVDSRIECEERTCRDQSGVRWWRGKSELRFDLSSAKNGSLLRYTVDSNGWSVDVDVRDSRGVKVNGFRGGSRPVLAGVYTISVNATRSTRTKASNTDYTSKVFPTLRMILSKTLCRLRLMAR